MGWSDSAEIRAKMASLEQLFFDDLAAGVRQAIVSAIAIVSTIGAESVTFTWNDLLGGLREWIGKREYDDMQSRKITLIPRHWQKAVKIDKDHFADDLFDLAKETMLTLPGIVEEDYAIKVIRKLLDGYTDVGWDGVTIFSNSHPVADGTVIDNLTDAALDATSLAAAELYFGTMKAPTGDRKLRIQPDLLVTGPANEAACRALFDKDKLANGEANINYKRYQYMIDPEIEATDWFLLCTNKKVKPIRLVLRKLTDLVFDEADFDENVVKAGVDARHDAVWTSYQLAYGSTGDN